MDRTCVAVGADIDASQLARAAANLVALPRGVGERIALLRSDAAALPVTAADCVLCDLPWGPQYGSAEQLARLYRSALGECARVLGVGAKAVFLTSEQMLPALRAAVYHARLRLLRLRPCPLGYSRSLIAVTERVADGDDADADDGADDVAVMAADGGAMSRRLEWEGSAGRAEWTALRKAGRRPMVPWPRGARRSTYSTRRSLQLSTSS